MKIDFVKEEWFNIEIGDYKLPINSDARVEGVGFTFEIGSQFTGRADVYSDAGNVEEILQSSAVSDEDKDKFSKIIDKAVFYPVVRFGLTIRLF